MKLFTTRQIKLLDACTIEKEPIASIDLMERTAMSITDWLLQFFSVPAKLIVIAGTGNNGGDALAVARLLCLCRFDVSVYLINPDNNLSPDCAINKERLLQQGVAKFTEVSDTAQICSADKAFILDGLFGSGLNRPPEGLYADVIEWINKSALPVISIDIPSGLFGEDNCANGPKKIVEAQHTLSLQFPKMAFFFPENEQYVGEWHILDIGLHLDAIQEMPSSYYFTKKEDIQQIIKKRSRFSHKGTFGHALFIGGSYGKMGAAVLASRACLRTGAGLLSVRNPECGTAILQTSVPEAMCIPDKEWCFISSLPENLNIYSAIGCGCGMETKKKSEEVIKNLLKQAVQPLVLDADALNILSIHSNWLYLLPKNTILTPHPKEFERLAGTYKNRWEQIEIARVFCQKYRIFVILKGNYSAIICPDGNVHFNSTGNAGMATSGSGDVLCGMILSLLTQGYSSKESALLGTYLHGIAGDYALQHQSEESLIASDIINFIADAFKENCLESQ